MRARYRSVCVKFREDDPLQMRAWEYLRSRGDRRSYSRIISEALVGKEEAADIRGSYEPSSPELGWLEERLDELREICVGIREHISERRDNVKDASGALDHSDMSGSVNKAGMSSGIMDMGMSRRSRSS